MKAVRTQQKYKCDFCKRRSIKSAMERHEKVCYRNPNRFCGLCENKGFVRIDINNDGSLGYDEPCHYCSKFDPKMKKAIEKYEESIISNN